MFGFRYNVIKDRIQRPLSIIHLVLIFYAVLRIIKIKRTIEFLIVL